MTAKDLQNYIGKRVSVRFESVQVTCMVYDAKQSYGNTRLLVEPEAGSGEQWVELSRVKQTVPSEPTGRKFKPEV